MRILREEGGGEAILNIDRVLALFTDLSMINTVMYEANINHVMEGMEPLGGGKTSNCW